MTWINTVAYEAATGKLKKLYDRVKGPDNNVDNIMLAHSLRPHSMEGHMAIYKNVIHHSGNKTDKWLLEACGVYVSHLNGCHYCFEHHFAGMKRLLKNDERSEKIKEAIIHDAPQEAFEGSQLAIMHYARKLTMTPANMVRDDVTALQEAGIDDGEILEINQVVSYFSYANRTVLGLGVNTVDDIIGLSPNNSDDPDNWNHT
ncbi:carboxymuconolactone decarboxylase family protein [Marinomonas colpomeniae]|uniref:Peroxidase-related enzyme n=1 Tax=Marinomonas colpomeniae TaxID=2774408 RepID=A0ABR8P0M5_9GAMM|nr:peroxidase-related enzyme [Marinomonas colpomeniae]MBD5771430.1 peroxidase-related enzyme [Marinomonas colpomeniae]